MLQADLFPYQERGVELAHSNKWVLLGDEQGLGKTVQALALIDRARSAKNLIVCPAMLKATWENEIDKFLPSAKYLCDIMSYEIFTKDPPKDREVIIFDEAHYLKNRKSKRARAAWGILSNPETKPEYLMMLTGTPLKNHITEFYSLIAMLSECPDSTNGEPYKGGFYQFADYFSNSTTEIRFGKVVTRYEGLRKQNLPSLKKLLRGKYIRRLAKNVLDLPEIVRKPVYCNDKATDKKLQKAWDAYLDRDSFPSLKAECALAKAKFTADYTMNLLLEGPAVVYTDHRASAVAIQKRLEEKGFKVGLIMGGDANSIRRQRIEKYKKGEIDCLVMTIGAASTGLTLVEGNHLVFNDCPWVPADLSQAEKRIHRIGQTKTAFIHFILTGKVDAKIVGTIVKKAKHLKEVHGAIGGDYEHKRSIGKKGVESRL